MNTRLIVWTTVGAVAIYGIFTVMQGGTPAPTTTKKKRSAPVSKKSSLDLYTKEDYAAKPSDFLPVKDSGKNSFKPLVYKVPGSSAGTGTPEFGYFRSLDTDGEPWVFSGIPELDGAKTALLENTKTGESVFLHVGESWKHIRVRQIGADSLVITGHDGDEYTVHLQGLTAPPEKAAAMSLSPVQPPPLAGAIGGNAMASDPNAATGMNLSGNGNGNGGGRRGRRNRGGGGNSGADQLMNN